jgi:hypothetical protein
MKAIHLALSHFRTTLHLKSLVLEKDPDEDDAKDA